MDVVTGDTRHFTISDGVVAGKLEFSGSGRVTFTARRSFISKNRVTGALEDMVTIKTTQSGGGMSATLPPLQAVIVLMALLTHLFIAGTTRFDNCSGGTTGQQVILGTGMTSFATTGHCRMLGTEVNFHRLGMTGSAVGYGIRSWIRREPLDGGGVNSVTPTTVIGSSTIMQSGCIHAPQVLEVTA
jgi:hypothetical protein